MLRVGLFLLTNLAVLMVANISLNILHSQGIITGQTSGLLVVCAIFGMGGSLVSLLISKWMAKRASGARIIDQPRTAEERWLLETVAGLARKAGIGVPEVGIFPARQANAFATGWRKNSALVAVSAGLLEHFNREEIRAVLAHEIGHVANGDMITLSLIQGVVNTFVLFFARIIGAAVDRILFKSESGHGIGYWVTTIAAEIVLAILASMIVFKFSRWREFRADAAGAQLAGRQAMISALQRLQEEVQARVPSQMPDSMTAFGISGGFKETMSKLFLSHPPLEQRIAALRDSPAGIQ